MQRRTLLKRLGAGSTAAGLGVAAGGMPTVESVVAGEFDERDWVVTIDGNRVALEEFVDRVDNPVARLREAGVTVVGSVTGDCCCSLDSCQNCLCCDC